MKKLIQLSRLLSGFNLISESKTVRGLMKTAVPLDDIVNVDSHEFRKSRVPAELRPSLLRLPEHPSIGYGTTEGNIQLAKKIMEKTKDHWIFLLFNRIQSIEQDVRSDEFADWLSKKNYPEDYKILIVADTPLVDDSEEVEWILHDIIGHSASVVFENITGNTGGSIDTFSNIRGIKKILKAIWNSLPPSMQNSKGVESLDITDKINDIVASIIFKDLTKDMAIVATKDLDEDTGTEYKKIEIINKLFDSADIWLESLEKSAIKVGKNSVNIVKPWR